MSTQQITVEVEAPSGIVMHRWTIAMVQGDAASFLATMQNPANAGHIYSSLVDTTVTQAATESGAATKVTDSQPVPPRSHGEPEHGTFTVDLSPMECALHTM